VCHQTVSLVARHLEANGIASVVVGSARDVVEECGVARFLFSDFPLGNPAGRPYDREMQGRISELAVELAASATEARTTIQTPFQWSDDDSWKHAYARVDAARADALRRAGDERRARQTAAKQVMAIPAVNEPSSESDA
jgi:D-proline reductase (dithiol) PrdB